MLRTARGVWQHGARTRHAFSTMSFQPPYTYIEADALASKLKEQRPSTAVVDVRGTLPSMTLTLDDDFEGGHIKGAFHSPSSTFLDGVNTLLKPLETCMLCTY